MKSLYFGLICVFLFTACKSDNSEKQTSESLKPLTIAEKIANAHGFKNWQNVEEVKFTFQVDKNTSKGSGRSWTWHPKTHKISMTTNDRTVSYTRSSLDSIDMATDRAFINDKFWLFVPFQLVWDSKANISNPKTAEAPISKTKLDMITITYPNEGGYTPGDAYDIYYDNKFIIKEWIFRKGNSENPSLTTTFENYKNFNGIKIAIDHKMQDGNWNLNFTDISITLED